MEARIALPGPRRITGTMNKPQLPKGHQSLLSSTFKYVQAMETDLSKTFARVRQQQVVAPAQLRDADSVKRS
jgi:hypothetical protein